MKLLQTLCGIGAFAVLGVGIAPEAMAGARVNVLEVLTMGGDLADPNSPPWIASLTGGGQVGRDPTYGLGIMAILGTPEIKYGHLNILLPYEASSGRASFRFRLQPSPAVYFKVRFRLANATPDAPVIDIALSAAGHLRHPGEETGSPIGVVPSVEGVDVELVLDAAEEVFRYTVGPATRQIALPAELVNQRLVFTISAVSGEFQGPGIVRDMIYELD